MRMTIQLARKVSNYHRPDSLGSRLRARRLAPFLALVESVFQEQGKVNVIDIGGVRAYWNILPPGILPERKMTITIINLPGTPLPPSGDHFQFQHGDGCDLAGIDDRSFHIAHSNSVVEHVGDWDRMVRFARELRRVADYYFVQTPCFWFPLEPHTMTPFFHWLPRPMRVSLVRRFALGNWAQARTLDAAVRQVERARILDRKMFRVLFPDALHRTERFMLLPKSMVAVRGTEPGS